MDHRRYPTDPADVIPPPAPKDDRDKLSAAVAAAGVEALRVRVSGYVSATARAVRTYLLALSELELAARIGDDLRAAGLDLAADPLGSAESIAGLLRRMARAAVAGGFVTVDDPLLAGIPWPPTEPGPAAPAS